MSELLPILHPAMQLCSICPSLSACCKGLMLNYPNDDGVRVHESFWIENWQQDAQKWVDDRGLDFKASSIAETFHDDASGRDYVTVSYDCPNLTAAGRCGIYETRPKLCRIFVPGTNELCVFGRTPFVKAVESP
jgi:Fe-S-cluster containining protein